MLDITSIVTSAKTVAADTLRQKQLDNIAGILGSITETPESLEPPTIPGQLNPDFSVMLPENKIPSPPPVDAGFPPPDPDQEQQTEDMLNNPPPVDSGIEEAIAEAIKILAEAVNTKLIYLDTKLSALENQ